MALNLSQFLKSVTRQNAVDLILQELSSLGFNTVKWEEGRAQRNHIESFAELYKIASETVPNIARGGLLGLAQTFWLDFLGQGFFGIPRKEATVAVHEVTLTAGNFSHSWGVGGLVVSTLPDADGKTQTFEAIAADSISIGAVKTGVKVQALLPGSGGTVGVGKIVVMVSPFGELTVTNPADPDTGNSLTTVGVDRETDARYTRRCELRWASLTYSTPRNGYELWALEADDTITRVTVTDPAGDGTVEVVCATDVGGITAAQIATVLAYINDGRRPINDVPLIQSAAPVIINIVSAPTVRKGEYATPTAAANAVEDNWDDFFTSLPIGGPIIAPSVSGQIIRDQLIEEAMALSGFRRINITAPVGDTGLSSKQVAVGSYATTVTEESP